MSSQNIIQHYLKEIKDLEQQFIESQSREIIPFSFFSSTINILNRLRAGIYEIESAQLQEMQQHLKEPEKEWLEEYEIKEPVAIQEFKATEEKAPLSTNVLADKIGRRISADFGKSLSLNDRFMFQRDLFQGNANEMNRAFIQINEFQSIEEVIGFLHNRYMIPWNSDSGIAFKELLEKRFA